MDLLTDHQLVQKIQAGDVSAFAILVGRYQKRLLAFIYHLTRDQQVAEEAVQDAFFHLYQTIERVDNTKKISSYLYVITRNAAYSILRERKSHISLDETVASQEDIILYDQLYRQDKKTQVSSAVASLESKYQRVITLYYFEDLSYEEIGQRLNIPLNTVRTHLARAKVKLKEILIYEIR